MNAKICFTTPAPHPPPPTHTWSLVCRHIAFPTVTTLRIVSRKTSLKCSENVAASVRPSQPHRHNHIKPRKS